MAQLGHLGKLLKFPEFFFGNYIYMEQPEVDDGITAIVWNREKKRIIDEHNRLQDNLKEIYRDSFESLFDESLDDFITKHLTKSLSILKKKHYPVVEETPAASSHLWIGINPPTKSITIQELDKLTAQFVTKYKWASRHAYTIESHVDGTPSYRPHVHMLCVTKQKPYRCIEQLSRHYNVAPNQIQCKPFHKGVLFGEHYDYIIGAKKDTKNSNVIADIEEKNTIGLSQYYQNIFST